MVAAAAVAAAALAAAAPAIAVAWMRSAQLLKAQHFANQLQNEPTSMLRHCVLRPSLFISIQARTQNFFVVNPKP